VHETGSPTIIIVTGPPAAGKTTVAHRIAADLVLPLLSKDELKELLADALGVEGLVWSGRLGGASFALLPFLAGRLLGSRVSLVLEANFDPARDGLRYRELLAAAEVTVVQVVCEADPTTRHARYRQRAASGARHPIHLDTDPSVQRRMDNGGALDLPGSVVRVDTSDFDSVDLGAVVATIRAILRGEPAGRAERWAETGT
jgi:predicted kinase